MSAGTCPILLLQGLDDPIVPPPQSETIAATWPRTASRYAYLAFEGESHGFRKARDDRRPLEAELSFYGQILGFTPPGVPEIKLSDRPAARSAAHGARRRLRSGRLVAPGGISCAGGLPAASGRTRWRATRGPR